MYTELSSNKSDSIPADLGTAWAQLTAFTTAIDTALGKWLEDTYSIGLTEFRAALHISKSSDQELRIAELSQKIGLNSSSVTRLVGRMEAKKLAYRDTCPDDGRGVYAVITEHGLKTIADIQVPYNAKIAELLQSASTQNPSLNTANLDHSLLTVAKLTS